LRDYAASLISDPGHSGPLKCPCCPRLLRVDDARVALDRRVVVGESRKSPLTGARVGTPGAATLLASPTSNKRNGEGSSLFLEPDNDDVDLISDSALELLERWDAKSRDELLRSMEDFRPCPHCSRGGNSGSDADFAGNARPSNQGGGYVTPDCLAPINEERERCAERLLIVAGNPSSTGIVLSYFVYYLYCTGRSAESDRCGAALQVLSAVLPSILIPILPHALRLLLATAARREILRPICVTCPCCLADFNLEASAELRPLNEDAPDAVAESASRRWKASNTRPCPRCASPILKEGGCNHMRCGRCRVEFCWACMRSRTRCRAYECTNGAPFGNAFGDGAMFAVRAGHDALDRERRAEQTLIERIDRVEALALRNLNYLPFRYTSMVGIIFATIGFNSSSDFFLDCARRVMSFANGFFFCGLKFLALILFWIIIRVRVRVHYASVSSNNAHRQRINIARPSSNEMIHNPIDTGRWRNNDESLEFIRPSRRPEFMSEEEQIAEAIARSFGER
jgi:hypothetical protein